MAVDHFLLGSGLFTSPPEHAFEIEPDDNADLPSITRAIYIGGGGHLRVQIKGGGIVTYYNLPSGSLKPGRYTRVLAEGTTATQLVGEY